MASHNHQTTRPDLVERILLRDPPPGHLLSYLDDLFADCDSRDLYLARLLAGAKPQSCYLRQRRGKETLSLAWLGQHAICAESETWLLDTLSGNGAASFIANVRAAKEYIAEQGGQDLLVEYEPNGDGPDVCRATHQLGGKLVETETYYSIPIDRILEDGKQTFKKCEILKFETLEAHLNNVPIDSFYRFVSELYRDVPHAYRLSEFSLDFMRSYFPINHLSLENSFVGSHRGVIRAVFLIEGKSDHVSASVVASLVDPKYRGLGIASHMRRLSAGRLAAQGIVNLKALIQDGNDKVAHFYRSHGAHEIGHRFYFKFSKIIQKADINLNPEAHDLIK
jgi:ribosomal protein S18 acetylase RimI-like enzyme